MEFPSTGNETIVRYDTRRINLYSRGRCLGNLVDGLSRFVIMGIQVYTTARAHADAWVAIGLDGARFNLPRPDGAGEGIILSDARLAAPEVLR